MDEVDLQVPVAEDYDLIQVDVMVDHTTHDPTGRRQLGADQFEAIVEVAWDHVPSAVTVASNDDERCSSSDDDADQRQRHRGLNHATPVQVALPTNACMLSS